MIIYNRTEEVRNMINLLKKLVEDRQAKQLAKHRKAQNQKQLRQIYAGLIERGY